MNIKFVLKQYAKMSVQNLFLPVVYRLCKRKTVDKNLIVFADAHHEETPFSMRYLLEEVRGTKLRAVTLFSDYGQGSFFQNFKETLRFMKVYANAGTVVVCDNFLPAASCRKRKETTVIQLWHACGALKKFGYDTTEDIPAYYHGNVLKNCDIITVSAKSCIPHFAGAMGLSPRRFYPVGVSRTDLYYRRAFLDEAARRFRQEYPQAAGKKVILWAPTFRGNAALACVCGEAAVDRLQEQLGDEWFVIKSLHPHLMKKEEKAGRMTAEELLPATDLLITDYSSILFDYLIFERPIVRFAPDLAEYEQTRGFYMDYRSLPGALVTNGDELYAAVRREYTDYDKEALRKTFEEAMGACDGNATQRILKLIQQSGSVE